MKLLIISIFLASIASMCGHEADLETQHTEVIQEEQRVLALNGSERWQADELTNEHVRQLQALVAEYKLQAENSTAEAYNDLGKSLEAELQQLFNDCTMKGTAHDMLHVYLVPLVDDVKSLEGKDEHSAEVALARIMSRLNEYSTYFK